MPNYSALRKRNDSRVPLSSSRNAVSFSIGVHNETLAAIAAIVVSIVRSIGGYKPPFPIPERQSVYHPRARRTASRRRDARQQSGSFVPQNQRLRPISLWLTPSMYVTTIFNSDDR
jgi:hypothetical protein